MKYAYEELLVAATVRELAVRMRLSEAELELPALKAAAIADLGASPRVSVPEFARWEALRDAAYAKTESHWYGDRPLTAYMRKAWEQLTRSADVIRTFSAE